MAPPTLEPASQADVRARDGDRVDNQDWDICRVGVDALSSVISVRTPMHPQGFWDRCPNACMEGQRQKATHD